ncbi:MAG: glycoside hydrolase family 3 C-terminal domain-containing protein [Blautia sp.]|nr:glycoside hydrolase family 3 C-terminal domain-containing protein [Blautia sp.]
MNHWTRFQYLPCLPLGKNGQRVTGSAEHIALSRRAAAEGMVLLKNDHKILPLARGRKVALFGKGSADYVKGGGGSGDVTVAYVHNLIDGMRRKASEGKVEIYEPLAEFYEENVRQQGADPGLTVEPAVPEELLNGAAAFTDTAVISICRFSGENWDRVIEGHEINASREETFQSFGSEQLDRSEQIFKRSDFYLTLEEEELVSLVKDRFAHVTVVLNVGGVVDTSWFISDDRISAALLSWQAGMEGGLAAADVLCGDAEPSGRLVDTFAKRLEDYPSTEHFHDSIYYVNYSEDIYVGYRYFETIPGAGDKVNYPFGFGLSYTEFRIKDAEVIWNDEGARVFCTVVNVGDRSGKEVVQLYVGAPQGKLGKPARQLAAFKKTGLLEPGQMQAVALEIPMERLASYDDLGKIAKSAYVLEKGEYSLYLGENVREAKKLSQTKILEKDLVICQLTSKCAPHMLPERMMSDGSFEALPMDPAKTDISPYSKADHDFFAPDQLFVKGSMMNAGQTAFVQVAEGKQTLDAFMDDLSIEDMIGLLGGHPNTGVANTYGFGCLPEHGVPNVMTADGPAGLRIRPECGIHTTAFPCATLLACTWNPDLLEEIGAAGAKEVKENNIGVWLTPAMNIHRSPLCGRNFEYYSEDPLIAGKMGAAMVRGIQSQKIAASVKHFCVNNKETCRFESDSRVSERALREIYLKGFEIVVKEADPWTIMSSYNILNGCRDSEKKELLTGILREEWGFKGMVTTDWWNHAVQYREIKAGNDVKMACGYPEEVLEDYRRGRVSEEEIRTCARRVLELILKL